MYIFYAFINLSNKLSRFITLRTLENKGWGNIITLQEAVRCFDQNVDKIILRLKSKWFVCLFVWVLWQINICRLFNDKSIFIQINSSISNNSV